MSPTAENLIDLSVHGGEVFELARVRGLNPRDILDFSSNVNPLGPPRLAIQCLANATWMIPYYPDISYHDFRTEAAEYSEVPTSENVVEGCGSTELIHLFAELFVREGDKVLIQVPTFGEYERAVRNRGGLPVFVASRREFSVDTDRLTSELQRGCKAVFLSSPNNPSSKTIAKRDMLKFVEFASEKNTPVFLDETFIEFTESSEQGLSPLVEEFPNLFVARSLTKSFALTGLRIGYGLASHKLTNQLRMAKMPWSVNVLAQQAAIAAFHDKSYLERSRKLIARERDFLYSELRKIQGLTPVRPEANFILLRITQGSTAKELKSSLLDKTILIRDCSSFRGLKENYFRISIKLRKQNRLLLSALKEVLN